MEQEQDKAGSEYPQVDEEPRTDPEPLTSEQEARDEVESASEEWGSSAPNNVDQTTSDDIAPGVAEDESLTILEQPKDE